MNLFITPAFADGTSTAVQSGGGMAQIIMLGVFFLIFWLLIWRPQSKRAKEHKQLLSNLSKGDETVTSGGILGRVTKVTEGYVTLQVADSLEMHFQKNSIIAVLPKGTMKAINT